jgi:hypothetical protein
MLGDENESPVWRQNGNVDQEDGAGFLNWSFRAVVLPQAESEPRVHFYAGLVFFAAPELCRQVVVRRIISP